MKERPILFSGPMVRALLDGRKTQTRRTLKHQPPRSLYHLELLPSGEWRDEEVSLGFCPYGIPGNRLWVKETWQPHPEFSMETIYRADRGGDLQNPGGKWKPSIFMNRSRSRITLEITDVRVERLQDISADDARSEGSYLDCCHCLPRSADKRPIDVMFRQTGCHIHGEEFRSLWESINGPDSWKANPWVWAITFKRITPCPTST